MNTPQFKINGRERRELKKELSELKGYVKNFSRFHQLDKDMHNIFKTKNNGYPMSDDDADKKLAIARDKIIMLENQLSIPYKD